MKCTQVFGKQHQLTGLHCVPLSDTASSSQTICGQYNKKDRRAAVAAILEEFTQSTPLSQSIGMPRVNTICDEENQYIRHSKPCAGGGKNSSVQILNIPRLSQASTLDGHRERGEKYN